MKSDNYAVDDQADFEFM